MKKTAKAFLILSIVASILLIFIGALAFYGGVLMLSDPIYEADAIQAISGAITYIITGIITSIFSTISLVKLNKATCNDDFPIGLKIVTLLFSNLVSGILLLCMKDEDF